jgi:homopolymeric O-antigen transport system permease protein
MRIDIRYLVFQLVLRDFRSRYKQTFFGALWIAGRPLLELGVFALVFGKFLQVPTNGVPYAVFAFSGIVLWSFFSGGISRATRSVSAHGSLVASAPMPAIAIPLAALASSTIDTLLAAVVLAGFYFAGGGTIGWAAVSLVPIVAILALLVIGLGLLGAALHVFYRDVGQLVDVVLRVLLLLTPVAYARTIVPPGYRWLYDINPLVVLFESARAALLDGTVPNPASLLYPVAVALVIVLVGTVVFRRTAPLFAETV